MTMRRANGSAAPADPSPTMLLLRQPICGTFPLDKQRPPKEQSNCQAVQGGMNVRDGRQVRTRWVRAAELFFARDGGAAFKLRGPALPHPSRHRDCRGTAATIRSEFPAR